MILRPEEFGTTIASRLRRAAGIGAAPLLVSLLFAAGSLSTELPLEPDSESLCAAFGDTSCETYIRRFCVSRGGSYLNSFVQPKKRHPITGLEGPACFGKCVLAKNDPGTEIMEICPPSGVLPGSRVAPELTVERLREDACPDFAQLPLEIRVPLEDCRKPTILFDPKIESSRTDRDGTIRLPYPKRGDVRVHWKRRTKARLFHELIEKRHLSPDDSSHAPNEPSPNTENHGNGTAHALACRDEMTFAWFVGLNEDADYMAQLYERGVGGSVITDPAVLTEIEGIYNRWFRSEIYHGQPGHSNASTGRALDRKVR